MAKTTKLSAEDWLQLAKEDKVAAEQSLANKLIVDRVVCFNSQQAVEKSLKALAMALRVEIDIDTHSIAHLYSMLEDGGLKIPNDIDAARRLTPCASTIRYGELAFVNVRISRADLKPLLNRVFQWVEDEWPK